MNEAGPSIQRYSAFFGRDPDLLVPAPKEVPDAPFVYRYPPVKAGFFKRIFTPAHDVAVYITDGMARSPMKIPEAEKELYPDRVELLAFAKNSVVGQIDKTDIIAGMLQSIAMLPRTQGIFVGPAQTCEIGGGLSSSTKMTGYFFGVPDRLEMERLCSCSAGAGLIVSVMPLTPAELKVARAEGVVHLLDLFKKQNVPNLFDLFRESVA